MPVNLPGFKGGDRTNIDLPEVQRNCLKALKAAGKKILFVNCSGSAIALLPETEYCDAIVQAWYGGESGGQAVADVLFGDYNPSGKLPITFYKSSDQLPGFEDYSMKGRTYRFMSDALFPFGYGLSYTSFLIGDATFSNTVVEKNGNTTLNIPISNTGSRSGTEILQVYLRRADDANGPLKTLRGFKRVTVERGSSATATITLPYSAFEFYDDQKLEMRVTPGKFIIWYGNSSADANLRKMELIVQ